MRAAKRKQAFGTTAYGPFRADLDPLPSELCPGWRVTGHDSAGRPIEIARFWFEEDAIAFAQASEDEA